MRKGKKHRDSIIPKRDAMKEGSVNDEEKPKTRRLRRRRGPIVSGFPKILTHPALPMNREGFVNDEEKPKMRRLRRRRAPIVSDFP
jgi:hypothetical protein